MTRPDTIDQYLEELRRALAVEKRVKHRILAEAEAHLREAAQARGAHGLAPEDAQRQAIARFGPAELVAERFVLEHKLRTGARGLRVTLVANTAAAASLFIYWGASVMVDPRAVTMMAAVFSCLFGLGVVGRYAWIVFQGTRHAQTPQEGLHQQILAKRRIAASGKLQLGAFGLFVLVWMPLKLSADRTIYTAEPWRAIVGVGGIVVLLGAVSLVFRKARRSAEAEYETLQT